MVNVFLGLISILVFVNVSNDFNSESKLFADNASLFSVVHDINISASDLNDSSETINQWAFQ